MQTMENGLQVISPIKSLEVTTRHLLQAILHDLGARVGGVSNVEDSKVYSRDWEWFDPAQVVDADDLPEHWQQVLKNQNRECWRLGYRYVHAPEPILAKYPDMPVAGIFGVVRSEATPDTVTAADLLHLGGQFTEYDTKDKEIWQDWIVQPEETEEITV